MIYIYIYFYKKSKKCVYLKRKRKREKVRQKLFDYEPEGTLKGNKSRLLSENKTKEQIQ